MQAYSDFLKGSIGLDEYKEKLSHGPPEVTASVAWQTEGDRAGVGVLELLSASPSLHTLVVARSTSNMIPHICKALSMHKSVTTLAMYGTTPGGVFGSDLDAMRDFAAWLCSRDRPPLERLRIMGVEMCAEGAEILLKAMLSEPGPPISVLDDSFWWLLEWLPQEAGQTMVRQCFRTKRSVQRVESCCEIRLGLIGAMFNVLGENESLKSLKLDLDERDAGCIDDATGRIIGEALAVNTTLRELSVRETGGSSAGGLAMLDGLQRNTGIELAVMPIFGPEMASSFARVLQHNRTLKHLRIEDGLDDADVGELGAALAGNTTLRQLKFSFRDALGDGTRAFCRSLETNQTLRKLELSVYQDQDVLLEALADSMAKNHSIRGLTLTMGRMWAGNDTAIRRILEDSLSLQHLRGDIPVVRPLTESRSHHWIEGLAGSRSMLSLHVWGNRFDEASFNDLGVSLSSAGKSALQEAAVVCPGDSKPAVAELSKGLVSNASLLCMGFSPDIAWQDGALEPLCDAFGLGPSAAAGMVLDRLPNVWCSSSHRFRLHPKIDIGAAASAYRGRIAQQWLDEGTQTGGTATAVGRASLAGDKGGEAGAADLSIPITVSLPDVCGRASVLLRMVTQREDLDPVAVARYAAGAIRGACEQLADKGHASEDRRDLVASVVALLLAVEDVQDEAGMNASSLMVGDFASKSVQRAHSAEELQHRRYVGYPGMALRAGGTMDAVRGMQLMGREVLGAAVADHCDDALRHDRDVRVGRLLACRRAHEAKRDASMVFKAASEGRPMELGKRMRLGKLAGGLSMQGEVVVGGGDGSSGDRRLVDPLEAARLGGHDECVRLLLQG